MINLQIGHILLTKLKIVFEKIPNNHDDWTFIHLYNEFILDILKNCKI